MGVQRRSFDMVLHASVHIVACMALRIVGACLWKRDFECAIDYPYELHISEVGADFWP